jgi:anti-sigma regulatory factor (Ser/Thr protein kinase)
MSAGLDIAVPGDLEAGHVARHAIAASEPTLPLPVQDDLALLVTELITNAVRHGGAGPGRPVQVGVRRRDGRIRVQVTDEGTEFDPPSPSVPIDSSGGWGLFLVDRIAERWGIRPTAAGTCVWFELPVGAPAGPRGLGQVPHRVQ